MPRVLYCARTCPPLEPPFPLPEKPAAAPHHGGNAAASATSSIMPTAQQHVDLDDPNSPLSPLPLAPNHEESYCYEYESESEGECPPTPEPPSLDSEEYGHGDECFNPYLENCPEYANIALEHYNSQHNHEIKYQLVKAIVSSIIRYDGCYYHVNFTARSTLEDSEEEFFFGELRRTNDGVWKTVCIVTLEEHERVGGFSEIICEGGVDPRHCFGCGDVVKHPVDGSLYEAGHYLVDDHFFHRYIEVLPKI